MRFFSYDRFSSASKTFVESRADNLDARMGKLIYGIYESLNT